MPLRIGQGFDSHVLSTSADRPLVLGGVTIPGSPGLVGHSDADVVTHALADAVLGAIGRGDLGRHFPDTDPRWAGADSLRLLAAVVDMARADGWSVVNADCTVIAQRPMLAPHTAEMARRLGEVVGAAVSIKATRPEGLGALTDGMAALCVVLLEASPAVGA